MDFSVSVSARGLSPLQNSMLLTTKTSAIVVTSYRYYPETKEDDFIDELAIGNLFVPTQYFIAQFERSDTRGEGDTGTK